MVRVPSSSFCKVELWVVCSAISFMMSFGNPSSCGVADIKPTGIDKLSRIVHGTEAKPHSWPWTCAIEFRSVARRYCGCSVISSTWIITAAHCLKDQRASSFHVIIGRHSRLKASVSEKKFLIKRFIVHEKFDMNGDWSGDIGAAELETPITFSKHVQPICLSKETFKTGTMCFVVGWGTTKNTGDPDVLRQAAVPLVSKAQCTKRDWYGLRIHPGMLCAGYELGSQPDACTGDSGGPLVCQRNGQWNLVGLTSWGDDCSVAKKPGVYTEVSHFMDWLVRNGVPFYKAN